MGIRLAVGASRTRLLRQLLVENLTLSAVGGVVRDIDPELPTYNARTMNERMRLSLTLRAAYSWLLAVFAGIALLLA